MKYTLTTLLTVFLLVFSSSLFAQIELKVQEGTRSTSEGAANALILQLPNTSYKQVNKLWGKYIKDYKGKTKYDRKTNEYFTDDAEVKDMSNNTVDITAKVNDKGEQGTELVVWFNLGVTYLSATEYPERYAIGEKIVRDFGLLVSADLIEEQLKIEEKKLVDYNEELKKLAQKKTAEDNNIKKQKENIAKAEESIKTSENVIAENAKEQDVQKTTIKEQEVLIEDIKRKLKTINK